MKVRISVNDFAPNDGNLLSSDILNMLGELYKIADTILLIETERCYSASEINDLANDIINNKLT